MDSRDRLWLEVCRRYFDGVREDFRACGFPDLPSFVIHEIWKRDPKIEGLLSEEIERVREPLEKEWERRWTEAATDAMNFQHDAMKERERAERCYAMAKEFETKAEEEARDADSLRAQLSEARAELEEVRRAQRELAKERDRLVDDCTEAQQRVLELENFAIEENHAIMTLTGIPRAGYSLQEEIRAQLEETRVDLAEVQQRVERLAGALRQIQDHPESRFTSWAAAIARAALSEEPATGSCAKRGPGVWAHVIPAGAAACTECGEPATGVEE